MAFFRFIEVLLIPLHIAKTRYSVAFQETISVGLFKPVYIYINVCIKEYITRAWVFSILSPERESANTRDNGGKSRYTTRCYEFTTAYKYIRCSHPHYHQSLSCHGQRTEILLSLCYMLSLVQREPKSSSGARERGQKTRLSPREKGRT